MVLRQGKQYFHPFCDNILSESLFIELKLKIRKEGTIFVRIHINGLYSISNQCTSS